MSLLTRDYNLSARYFHARAVNTQHCACITGDHTFHISGAMSAHKSKSPENHGRQNEIIKGIFLLNGLTKDTARGDNLH